MDEQKCRCHCWSKFYWKSFSRHACINRRERTVVDDLSSGNLESLSVIRLRTKFIKEDLECIEKEEIKRIFRDQNIIFHLPLYMEAVAIFKVTLLMYAVTYL